MRTWWSRGDQRALVGLLWVVVGLAVVGLVLRVADALRGEPVRFATELPDRLAPTADVVRPPLSGTVVLDAPTAQQQLLALLPVVVATVLVATGVGLLLRIVGSLDGDDPFVPGNARRLTLLALVIAGGGVATQLVTDLTRDALLSQAGLLDGGGGLTFTLPLWPLAAGLLVAFLAEVFARGAALREDVQGLV